MLVYADPDDLMDGWLDEPPETAEAIRLIRYASQLVRKATRCDHYEVDPAGLPVDLDIAGAMRDATCAQAAMWKTAGINPAAGTVGREVGIKSHTTDGGATTYMDGIGAEEIAKSLSGLVPAALDILRSARMASTRPDTW